MSGHYAGDDLNPKFGEGEAWKKVFGPVFIYVNSVMDGQDPLTLWDDAKRQVRVYASSHKSSSYGDTTIICYILSIDVG